VGVDGAGVRFMGAEPGAASMVTAEGGHLPGLDPGPLQVGVKVGAPHAWLAASPADGQVLGLGQASEPGR